MSWSLAANHRQSAVDELRKVRAAYVQSDVHPATKRARLAALDRKIDALLAVRLDGEAFPWCEDGVSYGIPESTPSERGGSPGTTPGLDSRGAG